MSFVKLSSCNKQSDHHSAPDCTALGRPIRPSFNTHKTSDRLRESSNNLPPRSMATAGSNIRKDRKSLFKEVGLDDDEEDGHSIGSGTLLSATLSDGEFGDFGGSGRFSPVSPRRGTGAGGGTSVHLEGNGADTLRRGSSLQLRRMRERPSREEEHDDEEGKHRRPSPVGRSTSMGNSAVGNGDSNGNDSKPRWFNRLVTVRRPRIRAAASAPPPPTASSLSRVAMIAMLIAVTLPGFSYDNGRETVGIGVADAGVVFGRQGGHWSWEWGGGSGSGPDSDSAVAAALLEARQNSPVQVCTRWAHQSALLNGTLYIYGGQAKASATQETDTWNNNLLTLDLTKSWSVKTPVLNGLPQPSGPPKVAMGYLWNDYNNLYLYGGQFADNPFVPPSRPSVWTYAVRTGIWSENQTPETSSGIHSEGGGIAVQRSAEGAGLSVPELGLSWYFGGHLDLSTTPGWSNQIARVYLKSLLEFTHPGYTNKAVHALSDGSGAGANGAYRNITQGGLQRDDAFFERADGVLVFIPGWGELGVLIGMGGGTNTTFANNFGTLDVYDIARSEWFHQETTGTAPTVRVNPCAVVAVAPDASSFQVHLFGGQNLEPYKEQVQYGDLWILSIPSFTWIQADRAGSNIPSPRAGHTCHMRDGQMVVVGGYIGQGQTWDSPGIYVLDASSLQWTDRFRAADPAHPPDLHPENSVLAGSYGYRVPDKVASVIGGGPDGSATVTAPASPPTGGPFATGRSPVFTITRGGAETVTQTSWGPGATNTAGGGVPPSSNDGGAAPPSAGLIAAGVIAGLAGLAAGYLGFCAWLYRRQVRAYRTHLAAANRYSGAAASHASLGGFAAAIFGRKSSKESRKGVGRPSMARWGGPAAASAGTGAAAAAAGRDGRWTLDDGDAFQEKPGHGRHFSTDTTGQASFAWVGRESLGPHTTWLGPDDLTPGSGTTAAAGASSSSGLASPAALGSQQGRRLSSLGYDSGSTAMGAAALAAEQERERELDRPHSSGSGASSTEGLLDGREPSFFSVVMGPRRALRVVNGLQDGERDHD